MFAQDDFHALTPDGFRRVRLVAAAIGQKPADVDPRFVREGKGPDDRLALIDRPAGRRGHQRRELGQAAGVDAGTNMAREPQGHDDFFQRRVAGPLAQAVDRDIDAAAPAMTAARVLAVAMPRSLCPWNPMANDLPWPANAELTACT